MKFPPWTPPDLIERYKELVPKAKSEKKRIEESIGRHGHQELKIADCKGNEFRVGHYFLNDQSKLVILEKLSTAPDMKRVWERLAQRSKSFKPVYSLHGGRAYSLNLFGACIDAELDWESLPKLTRTQWKRFHEDLAASSLQLAEQLLNVSSPELLEIRRFFEKKDFEQFMEVLEGDGHDLWNGLDAYIQYALGELLGTVPGLLVKLHRRALEHAKLPQPVSQPNSPSAKANFFVRSLSAYFKRVYGQPLHAHVAIVTNTVLGSDVDEDRVRALIRSGKQTMTTLTRKKLVQLWKEIDG